MTICELTGKFGLQEMNLEVVKEKELIEKNLCIIFSFSLLCVAVHSYTAFGRYILATDFHSLFEASKAYFYKRVLLLKFSVGPNSHHKIIHSKVTCGIEECWTISGKSIVIISPHKCVNRTHIRIPLFQRNILLNNWANIASPQRIQDFN